MYDRIVCLTEETVETLYLLGQEARIVGVTGYAVRPARVRREKPRVGAFTSADVPKILALRPDLVLTFSDLQAGIAADLIREGDDADGRAVYCAHLATTGEAPVETVRWWVKKDTRGRIVEADWLSAPPRLLDDDAPPASREFDDVELQQLFTDDE